MPITVDRPIQVMTQEQFGAVAYEVMNHAFDIHSEMGRFFDERVYQNELCRRFGGRAETEVFLHATHGDFQKLYRLDLLVDGGAVFEIKTASQFHDQHRSQLIYYLMMTGLQHGKLINFRLEHVRHEFVNSKISLEQRQAFEVQATRWNRKLPGCERFQDILTECLRDWGTGLDLQLYEDALTHFFGGLESVEREIEVVAHDQRLGSHSVKVINPTTTFKLTSLNRDLGAYESHLRRFLRHTELEHVLWVNITRDQVQYVLVSKNEDLHN